MRKALLSLLIGPLLVLVAYTGWWFYIAKTVRTQIGATQEITHFKISGFPGNIVVTGAALLPQPVQGQIHNIVVPSFILSSKPFHNAEATLILPQGLYMDGGLDRDVWSLDYLHLQGPLPLDLPSTINQDSLSRWRDAGGMITINHFVVKKRDLNAEGAGTLTLDQALQPTGQVNARIRGHLGYIKFMTEKNLIDSKGAMLASTILGGLSSPDEESGEHHMDIGISLMNRTLYAGPLAVAQVPLLDWGSGNPPVSHQLPDAVSPVSGQTYPAAPDHPPSE